VAVRREEARDHDGGTPPPDGIPAGFHPAGAPVPEVMRTARALLRPLRTTDVDLDYDAVMSSAAELRRCRGSEWPRDGFTLEENLADLERHEREHIERKAFTYTVLNPEGTRCLGCVYIVPVWAEAAHMCGAAACAACVGFWVRASEIEHDLDKHLLAVLLECSAACGRSTASCSRTTSRTRDKPLFSRRRVVAALARVARRPYGLGVPRNVASHASRS